MYKFLFTKTGDQKILIFLEFIIFELIIKNFTISRIMF